MNRDEFKASLDRLFRSRAEAERFYGISERTMRRWISGEAPVPTPVGKLTALMTARETTPRRVDHVWMKEMGL